MMAFVKLLLGWITGPITNLVDKWVDYRINKAVVQAAVITGALESTAEVSKAIAALQAQEIQYRIFLWTKVAFMWLALVYIGAHVLQALYFHDWGIENVIASISVWFGYIMAYLFIAGPYGLTDILRDWLRK